MKILWIKLIVIFISVGCNSQTLNKKTSEQLTTENSIFSKKYRELNEFECFKDYEHISSAIIGENNGFDFSLTQIRKNDLNILIFNKVYPGPKSTYEILDTLQIQNLSKNEYISFQLCRKDTINDSEIIAIVINDDSEYYNKIIKSWRANRKTGKICAIDIIGIDCLNEGYGLE